MGAETPYSRPAYTRFSIAESFLKNDASTETRLMSRLTASSSSRISSPKMVTEPASASSSVEKTRMSVDLPEPFAPSNA